jgi:hypothetical protein
LRKEAEHRRKTGKGDNTVGGEDKPKRLLENGDEDEELAKRRKILEQTRDIDAESEAEDTDERYPFYIPS